ncbi:3-hydroxyacyl-CoA dehydrogenase [Frankia torreyi]|uniref:3-hydroxyacyl-CoA dehydrogenase n=2 Tax=Frankiaceae TaxID=74712 RepID=A0A0D8BBB4_9ACTN|nr:MULTISPECIES: 3-hydroxybutyryl-CoA dehydrogenase [Frankia]KJE21568.1 3-hydroxyacyl-CoA dehydrogenase [Frankia torreyi]KQM06710.1 3-hydroxyacyl-CoA dehydrogenase [Frankia sp. CpI1-P]
MAERARRGTHAHDRSENASRTGGDVATVSADGRPASDGGPRWRRVGVVGLGTMGAGIAEVLARAGLDVVGVERDTEALGRARGRIEHSLDRAARHGHLTDDVRGELLGRLSLGTELAAVAGCDLVIEAIDERLDAKTALFARLDEVCPPATVLATNTSSLSVTELAAGTDRSARVLGMHWFNPAPVMGLVEVVRTVVTDADALAAVVSLVGAVGKTAVVAADRAGFIVNALLFGYLNNAVRMVEARFATREDVDAAMRLGCGHPMGPLALLDLIGLDAAHAILASMYDQTRDHLHAPAPLLGQLVAAGLLGRKTGRGFYTYPETDSPDVPSEGPARADPGAVEEPGGGVGGAAMRVRSVGIVGSGTMARGIAEVLARSGHDVVLRARRPDAADAALGRVEASLAAAVAKGRLSDDDRDAALGRLRVTTDLGELGGCDVLLEAVVEDLAVKRELFTDLDKVARPGAVLATTTSSLPVVECATATRRPEDVVGMHWFNPAQVMRLVEVVPTVLTGDGATATVLALARAAGRHPVRCADRAGFIVNALLFPYLNDAVKMLQANYATIEDIDTAMTVGCGHPMGPFALADVVGLDVTLAITRSLYEQFREPGYAPAPLLEHLVRARFLGRKTGRGFLVHPRR